METITFADDYQDATKATQIYTAAAESFIDRAMDGPLDITDEMMDARLWLSAAYCAGKLNGEAGEVAEAVFKTFRDNEGVFTEEKKEQIAKELGDVLWYLARLADLMGYRLSDIMTMNVAKLQSRKLRGVLGGSGDER